MSREIKFRGLSIFKNEWWDGFYIYSEYENKHFIVQNAIDNNQPNGSISFAHFAEVITETVGQFTGLKDNKGKGNEIYEGDIFNINGTIYFVQWDEDGCKFVLTTGRGYDTRNCFDLTCDSIYYYTVIGNIHEAP